MPDIAKHFSWIFKISLAIVTLTTLFLFTNLSTDFYDTGKLVVILIFLGLGFILLSLKYVLTGKIVFVRTPLDIPFLLLGVVGIVSTVTSSSPYVALLGNQARISASLVALMVYILLYFLLTNSLKSILEIKLLSWLLVAASTVLSLISLFVFFGMKILPAPWVHGINFTTTGSSFTTTAVLALSIPFLVTTILTETKSLFSIKSLQVKIISSVILTIFGITLALTGTVATYIAALAAFFLTIFINKGSLLKQLNPVMLGIPVIGVVLVSLLAFITIPGLSANPFRTQSQNFPRELQLDIVTSWKTSISAFRDSPFWGSGPATYLFDFTNYKPIEFNASKVWNIRFDTPFNEYLLTLSTLGGIGIIALLSITAMFIRMTYKIILISQKLQNLSENNNLVASFAISGLIFFLLLALHASTFVLWVIGILILASFASLSLLTGYLTRTHSPYSYGNPIADVLMKITNNVSANTTSEETISIEALPSVILTVTVAAVLVTFFFGGKFVLADYHHRLALNAGGQNQLVEAYQHLVEAERLNPINDLYRTNLAQTNFAWANAIAISKGPSEASPAGSLTEQDKTNIQTLLQQSITEGRNAVSLSPRSAINWEILALLYRQISGVAQNALVFSLDSYGRAIQQDPLNPQLRLSVGGVYYAIQNYDLAIRFFTDAANLKPDYANSFYNLSVALREKGDYGTAQAAAEQVLKLVDANSADYKVANDYLIDLKNRVASTSALKKENLPPVNLGNKPEKIATPAAIKKPNTTPEPTAKP